MSLTVRQTPKYKDSVCIQSGDAAHGDLVFDFELYPEKLVAPFRRLNASLENAQAEMIKAPDSQEAAQSYGECILNLFVLFFGTENTEKIVDFYDGRYADMLADFVPIIRDNIMPKLRDASRKRALSIVRKFEKEERQGFLRRLFSA